jgi:AcrR family transcriptional regulator
VSSFTKEAITGAFLRLIGKKSLEKITVRDIVDECGINRNTFYYHFQDMYAVLEDLCRDIVGQLPTDGSLCETMTCFLEVVGDFATAYTRPAYGLVQSLGYDGFYRYLAPHLQGVVLECLQREHHADGTREYLRHMTMFICHAVIGLTVDVLKSGAAVTGGLSKDLKDILYCLEQNASNRCRQISKSD